jgi:hypothetical protein
LDIDAAFWYSVVTKSKEVVFMTIINLLIAAIGIAATMSLLPNKH